MARTETVTVVFTDLVGSTELASRLGHDASEALRHELVQPCFCQFGYRSFPVRCFSRVRCRPSCHNRVVHA